jgi:hypothetical protein
MNPALVTPTPVTPPSLYYIIRSPLIYSPLIYSPPAGLYSPLIANTGPRGIPLLPLLAFWSFGVPHVMSRACT